MHKSGFVSIIGNPNVGKSTIMNLLVGERLSIVTSKSQTTRHRIFGIVDKPDYQIVYSDTPGILSPEYELQKAMLKSVEGTLEDSDVLLYITDVVETPDKHPELLQAIAESKIPKLVVINKIDLASEKEVVQKVEWWAEKFKGAQILPTSALHNFGVDLIEQAIVRMLPEGPKYYPEDTLTDRPTRFFVTEIIREKILLYCHEEVPYCVEVEVRSYEETPTIDKIEAVIYVARDSQRGILIGKKGSMLRKIGTAARLDMEKFLQKKVFLKTIVQVASNWREDQDQLRKFGYIE